MIQIATSGPDSDWASIMQAFFSAITHAQHHIYISSPYFLPNEAILTAVKVAALSGIDVRIMIPSRSDSKVVYWASRSYIGELIDANVKVYLYRRGFNHSKLIMIDGQFSSVGTANMDIRSFGAAVRPEDHAGAGSGVPARPRSEPHGNARLLGESPRAA